MDILLFVSGFLLTLKNNIILNSYPYEGGGLSNYLNFTTPSGKVLQHC